MTKLVYLAGGFAAIVDDADYDSVSRFSWSLLTPRTHGKYYRCYAQSRTRRSDGSHTLQTMHRLIMNAPAGTDVDHINGDGLDNRRANLRLATRSQNMCNRGPNANNKSGYKGVSWMPKLGKWRATIVVNGKQTHLGLFSTPEDAHATYCDAAKRLHGSFWRGK